MFARFYPNEEHLSVQFADKVVTLKRNVSPAQIQGYFLFHKNSNGQQVIDNIEQIWKID